MSIPKIKSVSLPSPVELRRDEPRNKRRSRSLTGTVRVRCREKTDVKLELRLEGASIRFAGSRRKRSQTYRNVLGTEPLDINYRLERDLDTGKVPSVRIDVVTIDTANTTLKDADNDRVKIKEP